MHHIFTHACGDAVFRSLVRQKYVAAASWYLPICSWSTRFIHVSALVRSAGGHQSIVASCIQHAAKAQGFDRIHGIGIARATSRTAQRQELPDQHPLSQVLHRPTLQPRLQRCHAQ